MPDSDLTVAVLREIRDEIRTTRTDLGAGIDRVRSELSERIGQTNSRLDETNARLGKVEEALADLAAQQLMLTRYIKNVVDRHEQSIDELRERLVRVETKLSTDS